VIDRADKVVNVFEIKYSQAPFVITQKYDAELRNKVAQFSSQTAQKKAIWPVLIAPYGLGNNPYNNFFLKALTMNVLFEKVDE
jgi:uncharacterized protein